MRRIGIDCRFASIPTGLGRYTRELVPKLVEQSQDIEWILLTRDDAIFADLPAKKVLADISHYSISEQCKWPLLIRKEKLDLLFVPHFNAPLYCPVPFIVTVHDLILHAYPNQASKLKQFFYEKVLSSALKRAQSVITISHFTSSELQKEFGTRAHVIPLGIDPAFASATEGTVAEVRQRYQLTGNYFLYVGNAKEHKNVQTLIDAFHAAQLPDAELLLVSPGPEAEHLDISGNVRRLVNVDDSDLACLYTGARAFVTASLYEGFCLPVLEARACGCPVIASNKTAIAELAAPGVTLVDPTVDAFTHAFRTWQDPEYVERPQRSWQNVAEETLSVLY